MNDDLQDTPGADAPGAPGPSPASFWNRSTWDPNSLGAAAFGQPTGRQAAAMFEKLERGTADDYRNKAALTEIQGAYDSAKAAGLSKAQIIDRMRQQIQNQVDRGVFISNHLVGAGQAIDVQTRSLSKGQQAALATSIKANGGKLHREPNPLHDHVDMMDLRGRQ